MKYDPLEQFKKELIILDSIAQEVMYSDPIAAMLSARASIISKDFSFFEENGYSALEKLYGTDLTPKSIN